ncbi:hypothetical protein [Ectopseudomonas mendocina]|uniref:hypothetical protein n=1 Tax=Ectopseudomonas mendocina TaxID=300 RepID=UPI00163DC7D1|nr:hypothetical protein [Pseudomonas mendocina]
MNNEQILKIDDVCEMISEAQLYCANSDLIKNEQQKKAAEDIVNMFGAWREGD